MKHVKAKPSPSLPGNRKVYVPTPKTNSGNYKPKGLNEGGKGRSGK